MRAEGEPFASFPYSFLFGKVKAPPLYGAQSKIRLGDELQS